MKKRIYKAVDVNKVSEAALREAIAGQPIVLGVDVAKRDMFAVVADASARVMVTIKWKHPTESPALVGLLRRLEADRVDVAMEPTGTYGDPLRDLLASAGHEVHLVSAKRVHDAKEVYDGVPSSHDAKCAAIIAKLHVDGASKPWPQKSDEARVLDAAVHTMEIFAKQQQANIGRLEAWLARHWPELTGWLELTSASLLALLAEYGGPQAVRNQPDRARVLLRRVGGHFLETDKIDAVVQSASDTIGVPMIEAEVAALQALARDTARARKELQARTREVEKLMEARPQTAQLRNLLGVVTTAVVFAEVGDPASFESSAALVKACGLNVKIRQSGKRKGQLAITKRGSGMVRKYLYLGALRLIHQDQVIRAWYQKKCARDGGKLKLKAIVAVMRKLVKALPHLARGETFDASRLFDTRRLSLAAK